MKDYVVRGAINQIPSRFRCCLAKVEEQRLTMSLSSRAYRQDTQMLHITETSDTRGPRHIQEKSGAVDNF